jgi:hypothetical protein
VYCADSTGVNPSPLNCARGSVSACKIR